MAKLVQAVAEELVAGVDDLLSQAGAVLTGNQAEYIKSGEPGSIYGKLQQGAARQACRRYADNPGAYSGRAAALVENACRPYLDSIGYGDGPGISQPFSGGQCAVRYDVRGDRYNLTTGALVEADSVIAANVQGPLGTATGPEQPPPAGCSVGSFRPAELLVTQNIGNVVISGAGCSEFHPQRRNVRVVRRDGLPDNCGSEPPNVLPPVPPPVPGPPRERYNPDPSVNVDIGVQINVDGSINIDFGTGPITIDPFGDGGGGGEPGGGGPPPGDVGSPGSPVVAGGGEDVEGEAPPGSVLVGLKVDILDDGGVLDKYTEDVRRGVGYFYMGVPGLLDQDFGGSMLRSGQFLFAEKDNLTAWRASARVGVTLRITPYYREVD